MDLREVNFDGLVGPTHNYAGLSLGNLASTSHRGQRSHPRAAALQGLAKMRLLMDLGIPQGVLPPHMRPHLGILRRSGFTGKPAEIINRAAREAPALLAVASSASAMWTANAATVAPSVDTADGRLHMTPANLLSKAHRMIEGRSTRKFLKSIFRDTSHFIVHNLLLHTPALGDEGAANHTRFGKGNHPGLHLFVYGVQAYGSGPAPSKHPARQTAEASHAVARLHGIPSAQCVFAQQSPAAIDAGVFHNDVISVGHGEHYLVHEKTFVDTAAVLSRLKQAAKSLDLDLRIHLVTTEELSLKETIRTYLFNSQIVTDNEGRRHLIAPADCAESAAAKVIQRLGEQDDPPWHEVHFLNLRESMQNGGGPACLRLRVPMTQVERNAIKAKVILDDDRHARLISWVEKHYRESIEPNDLGDPSLYEESQSALEELTGILELEEFYAFQVG